MIKRTIEISRAGTAGSVRGQYGVHLAVRDGQLLILYKTEPPKAIPAMPPNLAPGGSIPVEDLGIVMVDQREASYSHHALVSMAEAGAAVVLCGRNHLPEAMLLPISTSTDLASRLDSQINASKPTVKRLWQMVVRAKLRAQACTLPETAARQRLLALADRVRSGDPENLEGQGAVAYWPAHFASCPAVKPPFRRVAGRGMVVPDRSGPSPAASERDSVANDPESGQVTGAPPNNLLDYGYAAIRAMVARAVVSAGLLPAIGIQHRGRSNPFCLADDLMEPLRPMIDARVKYLCLRAASAQELVLDQDHKAELLKVLAEPVLFPSATRRGQWDQGPLMIATQRMVASFVRILESGVAGSAESMSFPILPHWLPTLSHLTQKSIHNASTLTDNGEEEDEGTP